MGILETLQEAKSIEPIAVKNGVKIVSFADAATLANADFINKEAQTGMRTYNPDGTLARSRKSFVAINEDSYFSNRYKVKSKKMYVVTDYRAIKEQSTGKCYIKNIPCYVFYRDENGKLAIEKVQTISDSEFVSDFVNTLDKSAMRELLPLIATFGHEVTASTMPI